ncbi:MAG: hypothetical protein CML05_14245 [Pseudozobellia sp.]|nr:hypothetical protein [Pseudozobellia sp.]
MLKKYIIYKSFFLICFTAVFFALFSCNSNSGVNSKNFENQVLLDSINLWIDSSRNSGFSDSIRQEYLNKAEQNCKEIGNDSTQRRLISRISFAYSRIPDSANFRRTNKLVLQLSEEANDSIRGAEAHWDLAIFFNNEAFPDSAYYHFSKAQKIYENLKKDFESARMLYNMARTQATVRDYTGSEINTIRAIELLKPLNQNKHLFYNYSNLGSVTKELRDYDRAIEYYQTAAEYQEKIQGKNNFDASLQNNIGVVYQEQGKYKESIPYFQKVLNEANLIDNNPKLYGLALNHLSYSRLKAGSTNGVENDLKESIAVLDSIENIPGLARAHYNFSEFYLAKKDTATAIQQAKLALNFARESNNNDRTLSTLQLLAKLQPELSSDYTRNYITLNDSLQQEERQVRNKFARIRFETDEFIAENLLLSRQKQLWTGIALAVLLLGVMSYFILDQRVKNQKLRFQQQQQAANHEIFNLMLAQNQKMEEGKKQEQKRISEELHDGVLGRMLGARMVLTGLNKRNGEDAESERKKAIDALQDVEKEIRAISHELSHSAYQKINNFIYSVKDLLSTVQKTGNFEYTFNYEPNFDWDSLKGNTKINLYRLIQESLQNCVKHSNCKHIELDLKVNENILTINVKDDGKGFAVKRGKKGIGMRNMASRVEKLNGSWSIESNIGQGTTVSFNVPLNKIPTKSASQPAPV